MIDIGNAQKRAVAKLNGRKKLSDEELQEFAPVERILICTCDICIPGPTYIDKDCPVHWDLYEGPNKDISK